MFTLNYKGWFIHGYCDSNKCRVQAPSLRVGPHFPSIAAAKRFIRDAIKSGQFE